MQLGGIDRREIDSHEKHLPEGKCRRVPASIERTGGRMRGPPQLTSPFNAANDAARSSRAAFDHDSLP
ncbi:hypothetical protein DF107_28325 [Burkholderia stagnalis]|uniref:Uncharacterized protein n=1 Tax=Burkholderia stagnalis TaxID=1503054 RepID=A0A3P0FRD8_9BURK|nr:hypothetical protein F7R25_25760 [Burkholderia stagnalis]RQQ10660.1 hypothetical protein DF161_25375 [Burkholderia stagnalis]RQQ24726.1 hypothetical protein DF163_24580 [Burkholderia stagnalis]RQQ27073.1 hypothetical protein DF149_23950 [Burkholderia stagnalis]RQQ29910.1 hypothetical protein DF148_23595 [Burkholderia stagnalis]